MHRVSLKVVTRPTKIIEDNKISTHTKLDDYNNYGYTACRCENASCIFDVSSASEILLVNRNPINGFAD